MTIVTAEFTDCTGSNWGRAPLVTGDYRAAYLTGSDGVPETSAELAAAIAAGVPIIGIDQAPGLPLFKTGKAAVADIESGAATVADAVAALASRRALGITVHTFYISYSALAGLKAALGDLTGCWFWVADYGWSLLNSQNLLAANADWGATQFGDPGSNPTTLVPGTAVSLQQAQFDIDCGNVAWMQLAAGVGTAPAPVTPSPAPPPALPAPAWPFGPDDYLSTPNLNDPHCHSGYYSSVDNHVVMTWQQRMKDRGWKISVDGFFGSKSLAVCEAFQAEKSLTVDGKVGPVTWKTSWTAPVTP